MENKKYDVIERDNVINVIVVNSEKIKSPYGDSGIWCM